jgi:hypothetical protein
MIVGHSPAGSTDPAGMIYSNPYLGLARLIGDN